MTNLVLAFIAGFTLGAIAIFTPAYVWYRMEFDPMYYTPDDDL